MSQKRRPSNSRESALERFVYEAARNAKMIIQDSEEDDREIQHEVNQLETLPTKFLVSAATFQRVCDEDNKQDEHAAIAEPKAAKANHHFKRAVLAAAIVHELHEERTFGRVKLQKLLYLTEHHLALLELQGLYVRDAAGPHDNAMMRSVVSQMEKRKWYRAVKREGGKGEQYVPLENSGGHQKYFERYCQDQQSFNSFLQLFRTLDTQRCEIVATLFAAWNDLLLEKQTANDDCIVAQVLKNWHEKKKAIPEDRWRKALGWMRVNNLIPQGLGGHTRQRAK